LGIDPCDEFIYLVIERCECSGWSYVEKIFSKRQSFPVDIIQSWAELAEGCHEMSKAGIYHRDLTLDNILAIKDEKGTRY
jgi:serine/threonine protein kinase